MGAVGLAGLGAYCLLADKPDLEGTFVSNGETYLCSIEEDELVLGERSMLITRDGYPDRKPGTVSLIEFHDYNQERLGKNPEYWHEYDHARVSKDTDGFWGQHCDFYGYDLDTNNPKIAPLETECSGSVRNEALELIASCAEIARSRDEAH